MGIFMKTSVTRRSALFNWNAHRNLPRRIERGGTVFVCLIGLAWLVQSTPVVTFELGPYVPKVDSHSKVAFLKGGFLPDLRSQAKMSASPIALEAK
jgi:hypothetical protein